MTAVPGPAPYRQAPARMTTAEERAFWDAVFAVALRHTMGSCPGAAKIANEALIERRKRFDPEAG